MNPFAGVLMFLICILETYKCFYKQPFSFLFSPCLPGFCMFNTRLWSMNPFAGILMFLIRVLETFKCFYKEPFSFVWLSFPGFRMFHTCMATYRNMNPFAGVPMFLICVLEIFKCLYKQPFSFLVWLSLTGFCMFHTCLWLLIAIWTHSQAFQCFLFVY